jgi:hypothetical protein
LTNGVHYFCVVVAVNDTGDSPDSNEKDGIPLPPLPSAPSLNNPIIGNTTLDLSWSSSPIATGYKVKYGTSTGVYGTTIDVGTNTSYQIDSLTNGVTYFFVVCAYNIAGDGLNSNEKSGTPLPPIPDAPVLSDLAVLNSELDLTWNTVSGATGYKIKYGTSSGVYTTALSVGNLTFYTKTGLVNGTKYYFVVTALNLGGESDNSNEKSGTPIIDTPIQLNPGIGDREITLSWDSVVNATGYKIKYGTSTGVYGTTIDVGDVTSKTITSLTNGVTYFFVVTAHDAGSESGNSNEKSGSPVLAIPGTPIQSDLVDGDESVILSWSSTLNAVGYKVRYGTSSGIYTTIVDVNNVLTIEISGLTNGEEYFFVISAYDNQGDDGLNSNEKSAIPLPPLPVAPVLDDVVVGDTTLDLTWSSVNGVIGYKVKYGTVSGIYTTTIDMDNVTSYQITSLENGVEYFVTVVAYNLAGDGEISNEKSGTPIASTIFQKFNRFTGKIDRYLSPMRPEVIEFLQHDKYRNQKFLK